MAEKMIDARELCEILHCAPRGATYRRFCADPRAPRPVVFGRKPLWWESEVIAFLRRIRDEQIT